MAFEIGPQIRYAPDGQRTYNKNGELVTHHGYFETLADQLASFTRSSVAYKQDGSQVASGVPRYEYARQPAPVWQDTFDTDQLADEYTSGGDTPAAWAVSDGILTGTGGTYGTLIKNDLLLQDGEIEVTCDQAHNGGIVFRYQGDRSFYFVELSDNSGVYPDINVRLRKYVDNARYNVALSGSLIWPRGTAKTIKITFHGSRIEGYFEDVKIFSVIDTAFSGGGVGVFNSSGTAVRFLDFKTYHAQQAAMVEEGTTNLLTTNQASVETDTTNFEAFGSAAISRDTGNYWHGNASLKVVTPGAATNEGFGTAATSGLTASQTYTASVWLKGSGTVTLRIREIDSSGANLGDTGSNVITLTNVWKRYSISRTFGSTGVQSQLHVRTNTPQAITFYADGLQIEQKAYATSWQLPGTARAGEVLTVPTAGVISPTVGSIECLVYVTAALKQQVAGRFPNIFKASRDIDSGIGIELFHRPDSANWHLRSRDDSDNDTSIIVADSYTPDGWHYFAATWDNSVMRLYIDGVERGSVGNPKQTSAFKPTWYINGSTQSNTLIGNVRVSNQTRTAQEIADAYATGLPLTVDESTTYLMNCNGTLQPTVRGFGLWSKNGRHILHDPQSGQGLEVWDDNSLKVLIGLLANGKIGIKTNNGEIYSGKFQTGNENSNTYVALNSDGTLSTYYNGKQNLGMWPNRNWGNIVFYEDGNGTGQLYASNESDPVLGGTKRRFVVWSTGDGSLRLYGPGIELDSDYVRLASSSSAQITVRGKIRDNLLPAYDLNGYVGQGDLRWNTVRAGYITSGDLCFEEGSCPICEQPFAPGDTIVLAVHHIHEEHHTMCIPIHDRCKGIPKTITVEVPETEKRYRLGKDGQIEVYHTTKFQEVEEQVHKIKDDYSMDEKTGEFKKKAVDQSATKDEAVEIVTVKRSVPVMKTVKVELTVPANT